MSNEEIEKYSKLIHSLTHYFEGYKSKEDLFQVGVIGLITAYKKFDPTLNVKFSTYAYPYILGEMKKLVREDKGIKISRNITKLNLKIEKAKILLSQRLMREPSIMEISQFLEIDYNDVVESLKAINVLTSFDEPINNEGKDITLLDTVSNNEMDLNMLIALKEELTNLTKEEKELISKRYLENLTQNETAKILGMTQVEVSRKESKIKQKIKGNLVA